MASDLPGSVAAEGKGSTEKSAKRRGLWRSFIPRFGCFKMEDEYPSVERSNGRCSGVDILADSEKSHHSAPTHLVVMVNGLIGSAGDWKFAAKQFLKKHPQDVVVHCSERNISRLTFDGVDVMGERLSEEVIQVIKRYPFVRKISFIGHSLGGIVARYAVARLYGRDLMSDSSRRSGNDKYTPDQDKVKGKICGLEPINFITFATPHLGSRGHKQVPAFCGLYGLEIAASRGSFFLGKSGKHLFLADNDDGKPPLLLRMTSDCEDLPFITALSSFKRRVAYANARFDQLVGWSTASLRRFNDLPKRQVLRKHEKYPHIINVERVVAEDHEQGASKGCEQRNETCSKPEFEAVDIDEVGEGLKECSSREEKARRPRTMNMEEEMLKNLTKVTWERVDIDFRGSRQRLLAHNTILVKTYCINSDGADVILHMVDNFLL